MSMTKLPTDVVFDLLVVEQLQDVVPCDECDRTAHWTMVCAECGVPTLACTPCRVGVDQWAVQPGVVPGCRDCRSRHPLPLPWLAL